MLQSYSNYKEETNQLKNEDLDFIVDDNDQLKLFLEISDLNLFETEEIKFCNMTKAVTDEVFIMHNLFYSREIPAKSRDI